MSIWVAAGERSSPLWYIMVFLCADNPISGVFSTHKDTINQANNGFGNRNLRCSYNPVCSKVVYR